MKEYIYGKYHSYNTLSKAAQIKFARRSVSSEQVILILLQMNDGLKLSHEKISYRYVRVQLLLLPFVRVRLA